MRQDPPETVTASAIADFVFCSESWRLAQVGHKSTSQVVRDPGTAHHTSKAVAETKAGGSIALGQTLFVLAILALIMMILSAR